MFCYGKETAEEIVITIYFKIHYDFFMDIKKSNFLEDCFQLSSFSLKIYNVNSGNRRYASVSSVRTGMKTH